MRIRQVREIRDNDRAEWMRMLLELYTGSTDADHARYVDGYLARDAAARLLPSVVFVAERPGAGLCGFLELSIRNYAEGCEGHTPYVESWFVDADVRRSGIGRRLIEAAERWSAARGFTELASDATLENTLSHEAHRSVGFAEEERVVHFRKPIRSAG